MNPITMTANAISPTRRSHLATVEKNPDLEEPGREGKGPAGRYLTGDAG